MRLNETIDDLKRKLSFAKPNSNDTRQEVSQHFLLAQVFVNYRNLIFKTSFGLASHMLLSSRNKMGHKKENSHPQFEKGKIR